MRNRADHSQGAEQGLPQTGKAFSGRAADALRQFFDVDSNMLAAFFLLVLPGTAAMVLMLQISLHKTIVIADAGTPADHEAQEESLTEYALELRAEAGTEGWYIPLERGVKAEQVTLENRYWNREVWISVQCQDPMFYRDAVLYGQEELFEEGSCLVRENGVTLRFRTDRVWEYQVSLENETLYLEVFRPRDKFEGIYVVDPRDEIAEDVARALQRSWKNPAVRLYFTEPEGAAVSEEDILAFVEEVGADAYVGLRTNVSDDAGDYGITGFYNDQYYISGFGNTALADAMVRGVVTASSNRGVGLYGESDDVLSRLTIPAAIVGIGYTSNEKEAGLLASASYRERLAEGLAQGLEEVCSKQRKEE